MGRFEYNSLGQRSLCIWETLTRPQDKTFTGLVRGVLSTGWDQQELFIGENTRAKATMHLQKKAIGGRRNNQSDSDPLNEYS